MSLTTQQFINRFGQAELLALTDPELRTTAKAHAFTVHHPWHHWHIITLAERKHHA